MKSTQLLSVVFSLIMFTGVTAGNAAFAESDELDDILEKYCEMTIEERSDILSKYELNEYAEKLATICDIVDKDQREESLQSVIDAVYVETDVKDETEDEDKTDENDESHEDYSDTRDGKLYTLDDRLTHFCDMSNEETRQFFENHPRLAEFSDRLANICGMSDYSKNNSLKDFIRIHVTDEDREKVREHVLKHVSDDDSDLAVDGDFREKLTQWCAMTDEEKSASAIEFGKTEDQIANADRYCTLDESARADFIAEHRDEFREHMKVHMMDKPHMDYERLCVLDASDRAAEIDDSEKLEKISEWCEMSTEEREDYKKEHHDEMKDTMKDKSHDFDGMSDAGKDHMSDKAKEKLAENRMKMSDKSDRLKAMIMEKHDISDERRDEIRMKYEEKHGDLDEKKIELRMKFDEHKKTMRMEISDERKSSIQDRVAEMKAFKAEFREKSSEMTDEEKQELRSDFIEQAKDIQLAWINPRIQMTAGIDSAEVECREGFSLVMKASNGVAMCLKADTALKMVDRGLVVPAN